ncbi:MAG TPA: signal peptidase I [Ktedonobacterales bacterium]|nr:signal peptidase I [Ktedonobacterales bacterium]
MAPVRSRPVSRTIAEQRAHLMREIVETLLFVALIFVIVHFTIQSFSISGTNMAPELKPGQIVVVNRVAYLFGSPGRGDVVLVVDPTDPHLKKQLLERVIAVPGDTVEVTASHIIVNGVTLNEPYVHVAAGVSQNPVILAPQKLGKHQYFVLNDNRLSAEDSRTFGPVDQSNILGKAVVVFWPLSQFSGINNFSGVFRGVGK